MLYEGLSDTSYTFGDESTYEPKEQLQQTAIHAENASEAMEILRKMSVLQEGGFFISDIDNTLRKTKDGTFSGKPGRITEEGLNIVKELRENGWFFGTVSNRSHVLVEAENKMAKKLGYDSYRALDELSDFSMHSEGGPTDLSLKKKPETISKVIAQIELANSLVNGALKDKPIVWMGDSYGDEEFGKNLLMALRERGYKNGILIKLTDRLGGGFSTNDSFPNAIQRK